MLDSELEVLRRKVAYYEEPVPPDAKGCFHKFTDEGICIRCGEDAEEWEAGCVEQTVEELRSICTTEFAAALERMTAKIFFPEFTDADVQTVRKILPTIKKIAEEFAMIQRWTEATDGVVSGSNDTDAPDPAGADVSF